MKTLVTAHVVQFSMWEYETFKISRGGTGVIGPNGAGKTSLIDAVQIAMVGGHGQHLHFNAQSVHKDARTLRAYALGTIRSGDGEKGVVTRKRDEALSYITLVFRGKDDSDVLSAGICVHAKVSDHRVMGLYVLPGVVLSLEHHLEDCGEHGKAPIDWEVFCHQVRGLARSVGRTPTITSHPETYVRELLHNLQQGVDARRFLRAFGHSINLKAVSSVGDFLRGYLLEATPIDKRGTLQHIKTLRALGHQIEQVREQISQLEHIGGMYAKAAELHQKVAVAESVRLRIVCEGAESEVQRREKEVAFHERRVDEAERDLPLLEETRHRLQGAYQTLWRELETDPEARRPEDLRELLKARSLSERQARREVDRLSLLVRTALQKLCDASFATEGAGEWRGEIKEMLSRWDGWAGIHIVTKLEMDEALMLLRRWESSLSDQITQAREVVRIASDERRACSGRMNAFGQGKRVVDDNVARVVGLFDELGIGYEPVAASVRVTDESWRGAIETFLGLNRMALLVEEGREDEAIELIRKERISDVTIVQPEHLQKELGRHPDPDTVSALLDGSNAVALAFLRRILGRMKCVNSAAELRREPRALTMDYMLSADGGTKRLCPLDSQLWMLGVNLTNEDRSRARQALASATQVETEAKRRLALLIDAERAIGQPLQQLSGVEYESAAAAHQFALSELDSTPDPDSAPVPQRVVDLRWRVGEAKESADKASKACQDLHDQQTASSATLGTLQPQLEQARTGLQRFKDELEAVMALPDWDHDLAVSEYARISSLEGETIVDALRQFESRKQEWLRQLERKTQEARDEFIGFINDHSVELIEERGDWRKAWGWVLAHVDKLKGSTLAEYAREADAARLAAEQSFQSDVKFKMREAILRVEREIKDLNKILGACPAFTNGEKYKFIAEVSQAHQSLYDLILSNGGEGADLFSQKETQANLMALLEASESGRDKGDNPLEDYRLLFNFDLEIRQDGKVVDLLSKRMGVASNGEHRVPFYVIAGAALATAYRIRPGEVGSGLMILDEAFYGMDAQNTFVTAEFLKSLGLQLLMAGPDSDVGKLTPLLDNYYDLVRYGPDVFVEPVWVKEPARRLLTSDIPLLHPELIDAQVALLTEGAE
ncbi:SbcC/MukB-like Walker B domain-containing protein [Pseudomonas aeruginosa]|uniref:SbcC/MukB-like Walker B domain-containing protein n=1 Tax=Pseudomonas aeruginosa TaxID=287 RepID=UPI001F1CBBCE|nr:SbcC/MukB-like Walker B domain-containing protein [Pseudomonas aeruginosa]MDG4280000.1 hypothetical protein [Pseudomonas aeruginosa]HBO3911251.1 hypothetical protein [Pseudomonas aeruginosa]